MLLSFANRISTGSIYQQCVERTRHRALGAASAASGFGTDRIRKSGSETARTATRKLSLSINQQGKSFIVYMSINPPAELKVFLFIARPQVVGFVVCTCPFQIQIPTFVDYATRRSHAVFVKWSSLRSIALLEHPVNHVRGGAATPFLFPPVEVTFILLRLHFALSRCPSLHRCCHPSPPRRRHHSIRPYAYAKSSLPSLPPSLPRPSLLHWPPHCTSPTPTDICVQMRIRLLVRPSHKRPRRGARSRCSVRPSPVSPTQPATPCTSPLLCSLPATFSPCPSARPPAFHPPSLPHRIFPTKTAGAPLSPSAAARSRGLCPIFSISMPPTRRHLARCARRSAAAAAIDVRRAAVSYDFG